MILCGYRTDNKVIDARPAIGKKGVYGGWGRIFIVFVFCIAGCGGRQADVDFARRTMTYLVRGWYLVRPMIDWPHLKMLEHDVGAEHGLLAGQKEKAAYEKNFIDSFKEGFKSRGTRLSTFFNWRMYDASSLDVTIVAANCFDKSKVFLFFIKHGRGGRKLVEVKALNVYDQEKFYADEAQRRK